MGCIWFDVCWCYVAVWLWWCGSHMQAEALLSLLNYQDDAESSKHKIQQKLFIKLSLLNTQNFLTE